jgi:ribosomal VAR1-like protein
MSKKTEIFTKEVSFDINDNKPKLFNKRVKKVIPKDFNILVSDTGKTRHFTPASQEWFNNIYVYNNNYLKSLPIADNNLIDLLKSYFNSRIKHKLLKKNNKSIPIRNRRLSTKRIFVGKGELKHTNNKVIITFFIYNTEGMYLSKLYKREKKVLFYPNLYLLKNTTKDSHDKNKLIITYNRRFRLNELLSSSYQYEWYLSYITRFITKKNKILNKVNTYYINLTNLVENNILTENDKLLLFTNKVKNIYILAYPSFNNYLIACKRAYKSKLLKFHYLLSFNETKFDLFYMDKLVNLVKKLYYKDVKFNIVNLKKMHLNSDIYTQAVALKLKNRNNRLYRILKSSLRKIKLPVISKIEEKLGKPNKNEFPINRIRNNIISSMFEYNTKDPLNNLLLDFFPSMVNLRTTSRYRWSIKKHSISFKNYLLKHLKHMKLRGIRVEAKGRLTRRRTASRSVFKMKLKGGLKNVESSFRGLSTTMLRGIFKSNVQYSIINSKNRNGAFGVKGWISSK